MAIFQIELGAQVTDRITGFKGTVTGRCEYMTGCIQYSVTPKGKAGKMPDTQWVDEVNLLPKGRTTKKRSTTRPGGPQVCPPPTR